MAVNQTLALIAPAFAATAVAITAWLSYRRLMRRPAHLEPAAVVVAGTPSQSAQPRAKTPAKL